MDGGRNGCVGRLRAVSLGLALLPCLACLAPTGAELDVARAELEGELGGYASGDTARVIVATEHYVELRSSGGAGAIMVGLSVDEGVGALEVGTETVFEDGRGVDVIGCAGPDDGVWFFDRHARVVSVRVDRVDEETRRVEISASWSDGSEARGAFEHRQ